MYDAINKMEYKKNARKEESII